MVNVLYRFFTRRPVAIQNWVVSNFCISQSTFSVKVLNLFSRSFFFFNDPPTTEISPLPLHDALPISGRLRQLLHVRERGVEQLSPLRDGWVQPLEPRHQLRRAGEPGGVEGLLELAGEPSQLIRVSEALRLRLERLVLSHPGRGALDLLDHVTQVVSLPLDVRA